MLSVSLSLSALVISAALGYFLVKKSGVVSDTNDAVPPQVHLVPTEDLDLRMHTLTEDVKRLTIALDEGIAGYRRSEKRIQKTVTSSRRLLRENGLEHAGLEAEAQELRDRDDEPIEPLPAMPEQVETTRKVRFPGASQDFLRRIGAA